MSESTKEFLVAVTDQDRIRVRFTRDAGQVTELTVQLECEIDGRWTPARRYDTAHGYLHVHPRPWEGAGDPTIKVFTTSLADALTTTIDELKGSWATYRLRCEQGLEAGR